MTAKEILEKIEEVGLSEYDFAFGEWTEANIEIPVQVTGWAEKEKFILDVLGLGEIEEVDQVGGEGEGEYWHSVKHFKDHDVYIKTIGFYSSYNGTDFYEGYGEEVKPQQKTITVFQ
jgi:hypothetical protein